ncbi:hypothetical protein QVD17_09418 [Tagetes erecta]|uniref:Uncharacterized protein n=1 Tax=Tagetes erecta TaxID=13708 RepID=A0AAD8L4A9_TARER|nr:hypothetical protein QVD17_09418 [Tagetes erecta]
MLCNFDVENVEAGLILWCSSSFVTFDVGNVEAGCILWCSSWFVAFDVGNVETDSFKNHSFAAPEFSSSSSYTTINSGTPPSQHHMRSPTTSLS